MNDILKQRLVGALVLIALGVVFWPVIFIETDRGELDRSTQLEPMPRLNEVVIPPPAPLDNVEPVAAADRIAAAAEMQAATAPPPEPAVESAPRATSPAASDPAPQPVATTPAAEPAPAAVAKPATRAPAPAPKPVTPKPAVKKSTKPAPASPALDEDGIPIAWVLQVASLSSRDKADQLTAQLIAKDYKAYSRAIRKNDAVLYRVFVGPVFEREKLATAKKDIDRELNVSAIIARYVP